MTTCKTQGQRRFDGSSVMVGLYSGIAPGNAPGMTVGEMITDFHEKMDCTEVVPIRDALLRGVTLRETIDHCRAIDDKDTRNWYKRRNLPAFTVSCLLWTRDRTVALEKKMRQYNPLIALDFDDVDDLDALRSDLRSLPWVYYAGLSVSGRGMFAVVAVDNDDCHRHKLFFQALKEEMSAMGYKVDKACSDVTRLRFVSYDPDPYFNEDCEFYSLPDDGCSDEDETDIATDVRTDNITVDERVRMYVEEWERRRVALCYYFLGCGLKAHKYFRNSPTDEMTELQKTVFEVLPHNFETRQGVEIAEQLGMPVRTFKRWLGSCAFKKLSYGYYEKRY